MIGLKKDGIQELIKPDVSEILRLLEESYPHVQTALHYHTTFELLVAVILSAQTTDRQVNRITAKLFPLIQEGPRAVLEMGRKRLEAAIQSCGLYRQKSRQIMDTCRMLLEQYGTEVPRTREELMRLPGVGRKTANIILSTAFNIPALGVDTHVMRVSGRLGLAEGKNPRVIEDELCKVIPPAAWADTHHRLIAHGRSICRARNPICTECPLAANCIFYESKKEEKRNIKTQEEYS